MRNLFIILILLSSTAVTNAQQFNWVKTTGGTNTEYSSYVFRDSAGNIYTVGTFKDTVDFDPGPGVYNLFGTGYNNNIFVQKLDADGNFIWAREWNSPDSTTWTNYLYLFLYGAARDKYGNIILTGGFDSTVDFDPGAGQLLFNSNIESRDVFVLKLDSAGQLQWARQIGGDHFDVSKDVEVDTLGNVYVLGHYNNYPSVAVIDLDPGPGVDSYTTQGTGGFVVKLDPFGNYVWGRHFQGQSNSVNILWPTMTLDGNRNIYVTGDYYGPVDFDPGSATYILTNQAIFIAKLDSAGDFLWAKKLNNTPADVHTNSIITDLNDDVYVTGYYYYDSVDMDPGIGEHWIHWKNNRDFFIEKLTPNGDFIWVADFPGMGYDDMVKATIDRYNNVICTGIFSDTMDFNPDAGETSALDHFAH